MGGFLLTGERYKVIERSPGDAKRDTGKRHAVKRGHQDAVQPPFLAPVRGGIAYNAVGVAHKHITNRKAVTAGAV